jgi:regulator of sirC expression with transglutaminase-like and TPR domain
VNDYYDARNSLLPDVLRTRRGIPITLALLYIELAIAGRAEAAGISFPGHFLVKLHMPRGEVVIDPFTGHSLSRDELDERLLPYRRQRGLTGDFEAPLGLFLQAAPPRDVIARLLRNLKEIHRTGEDWARLLPCWSGWSCCCPRSGKSAATAAWPAPNWGCSTVPPPTCAATSTTGRWPMTRRRCFAAGRAA